MSYLNEQMTKVLKKNISNALTQIPKGLELLAEDLGVNKGRVKMMIDPNTNKEISPDNFYTMEIFFMKNNVDVNLMGSLPEAYGDRLRYYVFKHHCTTAEFSEKTGIAQSYLFSFYNGSRIIAPKFKDRLCKVLSVKEFNTLNDYNDIDLEVPKDPNIVDKCNLSYNMELYKGKFTNFKILQNSVGIEKLNKFLSCSFDLTTSNMKKICKSFKKTQEEMLADNLNLNDERNIFGYWLAKQINKLRKTISGLADQTKIDQEYLVQLIRNEVFLKEEYLKSLAIALHVDEYGLWEAAPKEDHQLTHVEAITNLNRYVRDAIAEAGFSFKEFCELIGCPTGTMASSLYKNRLPTRFGNQIIDLLNLDLEKTEEPVEIKDDVVVDPVEINEGETAETTLGEAHPVSDDIDESEPEEKFYDSGRIVLNKGIPVMKKEDLLNGAKVSLKGTYTDRGAKDEATEEETSEKAAEEYSADPESDNYIPSFEEFKRKMYVEKAEEIVAKEKLLKDETSLKENLELVLNNMMDMNTELQIAFLEVMTSLTKDDTDFNREDNLTGKIERLHWLISHATKM